MLLVVAFKCGYFIFVGASIPSLITPSAISSPFFSHITTLKLDQKSTTAAGDSLSTSTPWNHGYSEMSGQRNKWALICVSVCFNLVICKELNLQIQTVFLSSLSYTNSWNSNTNAHCVNQSSLGIQNVYCNVTEQNGTTQLCLLSSAATLYCFPWPEAAVVHAEDFNLCTVSEALTHLFAYAGLLLGTGCVCLCWLWTALETAWRHVMESLTEIATRKCRGCCSAPWEMCCARSCSTPVLTACICATPSSPHTGRTDLLDVSLSYVLLL